jgi:hypothetical protein
MREQVLQFYKIERQDLKYELTNKVHNTLPLDPILSQLESTLPHFI